MNEYNFIRHKSCPMRTGKNTLTLNKQNLHIGKVIYQGLGEPRIVDVLIDKEKQAIKLINNPLGTFKVSKPNDIISAVSLARIMPIGIYLPVGEGIFVLKT